MNEGRTVWVAGATGLVGGETTRALFEEPSVDRVVTVVRRPTGFDHPKLDERQVDYEQLEAALRGQTGDVAICCLGTTIKQAGSREQFRRVDHDYVLAFARAAQQGGAQHMLVVTALGADPRSRVFYNRVKGQVEQALAEMPFEALTILRPSLLLGERNELRLGEKLAAPLSQFLPLRYQGIQARTVARALTRLATAPASGRRVVPSDELQKLGA